MAEMYPNVFSKAFILDAFDERYRKYNVDNVSIDMVGISSVGREYMNKQFKNKVGDENVVNLNCDHGSLPIHAINLDADGNNRSDLFEYLFEDKPIKETD